MSEPPGQRRQSAARDLINGAGYLARGVGWLARRPRLWLVGLIPAVIVLVLYAAALVALGMYAGDLAQWATPFADQWTEILRRSVRVVVALLFVGAGLLIAVVTFTALTLLIGQPFYENISDRVEEDQGGSPPEPGAPWWRQLGRSAWDAAVVGILVLTAAMVLFVLGFIPFVGQTVVPVIGACVSGYFLTQELTSIALERRGLRRRARFALLRRNRPLAIGFGAAVFVLFLIPLGAVLAMPGAVAGGTMLARERLIYTKL